MPSDVQTESPVSGDLPRLISCRMTTADLEEAKRLAAQDDRKLSAFVRLMYRRGVADFKAQRSAQAHMQQPGA